VRRYFSQAASLSERLAELGAVAQRVLDQDPLAPRLTLAARRARLQAAVSRAMARVDQCLATHPTVAGALDPLRAELDQMAPSIPIGVLRDRPSSSITAWTSSIAPRAAADACGDPDPEDRALLLSASGTSDLMSRMKVLLTQQLRLREPIFLALAIVVGVLAGLSAVLFSLAISGTTRGSSVCSRRGCACCSSRQR
jgi:hypothetical protein